MQLFKNEQPRRKGLLQEEKGGKRIDFFFTEDVIYEKLFIMKTSNQDHDGEKLIADSGATSHMVNLEENMTNLKDSKTRVTVGDSRIITGTKRGDWHGYQRHDGKLHCVMLTNTAIIPGLHANLFSVIRALQKGFQVMSEGNTPTLKETSTEIF